MNTNTKLLHNLKVGLSLNGDDQSFTAVKGDAFDAWLSDDTEVYNMANDIVPISTARREHLHRMLDAWLDGLDMNEMDY